MSRLAREAFFFKRGHDTRGSSRALFVTLGYQLALNNGSLHRREVDEYPTTSVDRRALPCKSLEDSAAPILLVNGLDECDTVL
jgi:hypothetical protein